MHLQRIKDLEVDAESLKEELDRMKNYHKKLMNYVPNKNEQMDSVDNDNEDEVKEKSEDQLDSKFLMQNSEVHHFY